ncbi:RIBONUCLEASE 1, ribonuclease 1 [Hibiscus trionum]|uniref:RIBONUCLEASE 1, ribonuclease 1 n=1 Tax=Hibiscus trionum TaxID=183268 RepID=A0A9W7JJ45_HIBTR|nr:RIBONUCLEASE 1, ribonuclease 1 [Hibiscus trionum]
MVMKLLLAFSAVVLASLIVSTQGSDFEFYKLSLIWPSSVCISAPQNCKSPIPNFFTIHGLWPTLKNGTAVPPYDPVKNKCNVNPMNPNQIVAKLAPIRGRLEPKWPNLINGKSDDIYWETEWSHHGMCSDYPQDPLTYFTTTLDLAENSKYDPLKVLGVPPSNTPHDIDTLLENVKRTWDSILKSLAACRLEAQSNYT